ncbi:MAG TPA: type II secretion system F family protein, partial [Rhodospirillales bacterium]|nr:type II secretion system F family protein [Rhodospirillales bacterium]
MNMILDSIGLGPQGLITLAAGVIAFITVYVVWQGLVRRDPLSARARSLGRHRDKLKGDLLAQKRNTFQRRETITFMRSVINRLNLLKGAHVAKVTDRLMQAGWRSKDAVVMFLFFKLCLPFVGGALGLIIVYGLASADLEPIFKIMAALVGVIIGAYLPEVVVKNAAQKRRVLMQKGLPDALDLMVICTESGLALDATMTRVARELSKSSPQLADEFGLTAVELG